MAGNLKSILAELIGTFALVFVVMGVICVDAVTGGKVGPIGIAGASGLILAVMVYAYGFISGGHFNPAITVAMLLSGRIDAIKSVFYIAAQLLGAALAGLCLESVFHDSPAIISSAPFLGACSLTIVGYKAGTLLEAVGTFFLASAYMAAVNPKCPRAVAPAVIGAAQAVSILVIGPLTGGALNPARAFGPAIVTGHWTQGYVYWIGPLTGAIVATWIYENLYIEKEKR